METLDFLPKTGVCGTIYLCLQDFGNYSEWQMLTWDGERFLEQHRERDYDKLIEFVDQLSWASGWPRVKHALPTRKMDPCVKVELQFKSGRVQRLVGEAAEAWLKDVNNVAAAATLRYGQSQMGNHHWEITRKEE